MSALIKVPEDLSLNSSVNNQWEQLWHDINKGKLLPGRVDAIGREISEWNSRFKAKELPPEYNWELDIELAQSSHRFNIDWLAKHQQQDTHVRQQLLEHANQTSAFAVGLAETSIRTLILAHGAVGLAGLGAVANGANGGVWWASVFLIVGSIIGLIVLGIGIVFTIKTMPRIARAIRHLSTPFKTAWQIDEIFSRYHQRHLKEPLARGDNFLFGSFVTLVGYLIVAFVAILN